MPIYLTSFFFQIVGAYPQEKNNLADMMSHGADVQYQFYLRTQSAGSAARMANILSKTVGGQRTTAEDFAPQLFSTNFFSFPCLFSLGGSKNC